MKQLQTAFYRIGKRIKNWTLSALQEVFPFIYLHINLERVESNRKKDEEAGFRTYQPFLKLSLEKISEHLKWEQDRAKAIDDKTNRMASIVAVSLSVIGLVSGFLPKEIEATGLDAVMKFLLLTSATYLLIGGAIALSNARTRPMYGVGLHFSLKIKDSKYKKNDTLEEVAYQTAENQKRHLINESSHQSIRNGLYLFFASIEIYLIGKMILELTQN